MKRGELTKEILKNVAIGVGIATFVVFALATPKMTASVSKTFMGWYRAQNKSRRQQIRKTFQQLRRERLLEERGVNGKTVLILSEAGKRRVLEYQLDEMAIQPMKKWDGILRIIIFDIPERHKKAREAFREKLRLWGCYPIQKSIFATPWPCRNEIDFVTEIFRISPYIRLIEAREVDGIEDIKSFFKL